MITALMTGLYRMKALIPYRFYTLNQHKSLGEVVMSERKLNLWIKIAHPRRVHSALWKCTDESELMTRKLMNVLLANLWEYDIFYVLKSKIVNWFWNSWRNKDIWRINSKNSRFETVEGTCFSFENLHVFCHTSMKITPSSLQIALQIWIILAM